MRKYGYLLLCLISYDSLTVLLQMVFQFFNYCLPDRRAGFTKIFETLNALFHSVNFKDYLVLNTNRISSELSRGSLLVFAEFKFGYKKVRNSCLWIALASISLVLIPVVFNKQPLFILCVLPALTRSALRSLKNQFPRSPCSSTLPRRRLQ